MVRDPAGGGSRSGGRQEGDVGGGRGGLGEVVTMSPLPVRGTGSCGPAVSTSGLQTESAAASATMGGKNKQRTKGNLRVSRGGLADEGVLASQHRAPPGVQSEGVWSAALERRAFPCRV
jgi:hypothetical protein